MDNAKLIELYLDSKHLAWSSTTMRSERYRLLKVAEHLDGNPMRLWKAIEQLAPYTRLTFWTRVTDYYEFLIEEGHYVGSNPYKTWRKKNAKQFKHVYQPKLPEISFEEARARILTIPDETVRRRCLDLLEGGLRSFEQVSSDGRTVTGKGGRPRRTYLTPTSEPRAQAGYDAVRRALARVGLRPHCCRKLWATQLAANGAREADLLELMGWSSMNTAKAYLAPRRDEELRDLVRKVNGQDAGDSKKQIS